MRERTRGVLTMAVLVGCLTLVSGCVPRDAGYGDVRTLVAQRTGHAVRWDHLERNAATQREVNRVLAQPLTAENAVKVALLNNAQLQADFEELGVARAELVSALRLPNPVAEVGVRFHGDESAKLELAVTEDLTHLVFLPLRHGAADAELDASKASVAGRALDLVLDVRIAFYTFLADRQVVELRRTVLQSLDAAATVARSLHDAGNLTELDFEAEQLVHDQARVDFAVAETALAASRERLNAMLGLWGKAATSWEVAGRLNDPSAELPTADLESKAIERSLDLAVIGHRFTAAAKRANLASAEGWLPEVKAGILAEREGGEWGYGPLAEVQVPLFYQGQGEIDRARAEMRRQEQLLRARAVQIRSAARALATRLAAARERALYVKAVILPGRHRIVQQMQLQYNAMSVSVFQLLQARRDEIEAARSYVEALRDYWTVYAQAEQLRAGRLPSGNLAPSTVGSVVSEGNARDSSDH